MRLAVLICGDFRAWPQASKYIFRYAEGLADTVDYYFVTWDSTQDSWWPKPKNIRTVTSNDITNTFSGRSLIDYRLVTQESIPKYSVTFYYVSYLAKIANVMKRQHELNHNMVYDQVLEIRPDLYIRGEVDDEITQLEPADDFEIISAGRFVNFHHPTIPSNVDFKYVTNSFGNDIMSCRDGYKKQHTIMQSVLVRRPEYMPHTIMCNHWLILDYIQSRRLIEREFANLNTVDIIRYNFPDDLDALTKHDFAALKEEYYRNIL